MDTHNELINRLKNTLKKLKPELISEEYSYEVKNKGIARIDLLVQKSGRIYLFECKSGKDEKKAKKQLAFHKVKLEEYVKKHFWKTNILSFMEIKIYYISEQMNLIVNVETKDEVCFDPVFLDNPLLFLSK